MTALTSRIGRAIATFLNFYHCYIYFVDNFLFSTVKEFSQSVNNW